MKTNEQFIEVEELIEANKINLELWSFIGLKNNKYCFKKRVRK